MTAHPNAKNDNLFQMIDFEKKFAYFFSYWHQSLEDTPERPALSTFLQDKHDFLNKGYDYSVVGILGSQSGGKSNFLPSNHSGTLLNTLFGTDFAVLPPSEIGQQTLGIWLGVGQTKAVEVVKKLNASMQTRKQF